MRNTTEELESTKKTLADLLEGHLSLEEIIEIVRKPKDKNRFETLLDVEQERVAWNDTIRQAHAAIPPHPTTSSSRTMT